MFYNMWNKLTFNHCCLWKLNLLHRDYDGYRHYQGSRSSSRQGYDDYTRAQWDAYYANYNRGSYGYGYDQDYVQGKILEYFLALIFIIKSKSLF